MKINIFLDDLRKPYNGFTLAKNYEECIELLNNYKVDIISLDHDLGEGKSGYDIAKYMVENNIYPKEIYIHSANPVGVQNIFQLLSHYAPQGIKIRITPYKN